MSSPKKWPNSPNLSQYNGLSRLGEMLKVLLQAATKPKTVPGFQDALQLICSALLEKAIDSAVKVYRKQLQARVSANGINFEYIM